MSSLYVEKSCYYSCKSTSRAWLHPTFNASQSIFGLKPRPTTTAQLLKIIPLIISLFFWAYSSTLYAEATKKGRAISNAWELPPLILNDLNNQQQNLYQWHGQVIMLNFWATWCGPCQVEIPDFIDLQTQYADQGLQIIGVGLDDVRKLRNYVRTVGINYPILQADPERQYPLLKQWGNPFGVLPFTVIIGRDGHFVFMQQGIFNKETFARIVTPLLTQ